MKKRKLLKVIPLLIFSPLAITSITSCGEIRQPVKSIVLKTNKDNVKNGTFDYEIYDGEIKKEDSAINVGNKIKVVNVKPETGYKLQSIIISYVQNEKSVEKDVTVSKEFTFETDGEHTLTVTFIKEEEKPTPIEAKSKLTIQEGIVHGKVSFEEHTSGDMVKDGTLVKVVVNADEGYELETLKVNDLDISVEKSFTTSKDVEEYVVTATFKETVEPELQFSVLKIDRSFKNGQVYFDGYSDDEAVANGTVVVVKTKADPGYELDTLTVNDENIKDTMKFTTDAKVERYVVKASFKKVEKTPVPEGYITGFAFNSDKDYPFNNKCDDTTGLINEFISENVYGADNNAIKFGSKTKQGNLTIKFTKNIKISHIIFDLAEYDAGASFKVLHKETVLKDNLNVINNNLDVELNSDSVNELTISGTKRFYINKIYIYGVEDSEIAPPEIKHATVKVVAPETGLIRLEGYENDVEQIPLGTTVRVIADSLDETKELSTLTVNGVSIIENRTFKVEEEKEYIVEGSFITKGEKPEVKADPYEVSIQEIKSISEITWNDPSNLIDKLDGREQAYKEGTNSIKVGSGKKRGFFTLLFKKEIKINTIEFFGRQYGSDDSKVEIKAGNTSLGTVDLSKTGPYVLKDLGAIQTKSLTFTNNGGNQRFYFDGFKLNMPVEAPEVKTGTVKFEEPVNGTVNFLDNIENNSTVELGKKVYINTVAADGYELDTLTVNGQNIKEDGFFVVAEEKEYIVQATFKSIPVQNGTLTLAETTNGTISFVGEFKDQTVAKVGSVVEVEVNPAQGYELDTLTVNEKDIKATSKFEVTEAIEYVVHATFKEIPVKDYVDVTFKNLKTGSENTLSKENIATGGAFISQISGGNIWSENGTSLRMGTKKNPANLNINLSNPTKLTKIVLDITAQDSASKFDFYINGDETQVTSYDANKSGLLEIDLKDQEILSFTLLTSGQYQRFVINEIRLYQTDWSEIKPVPVKEGTLAIAETTNGTINFAGELNGKTKARVGTTVTVEVNPAQGYELDTLRVNDLDIKTEKTFEVTEEITYTVVATFKLIEELPPVTSEGHKVTPASIDLDTEEIKWNDADQVLDEFYSSTGMPCEIVENRLKVGSAENDYGTAPFVQLYFSEEKPLQKVEIEIEAVSDIKTIAVAFGNKSVEIEITEPGKYVIQLDGETGDFLSIEGLDEYQIFYIDSVTFF